MVAFFAIGTGDISSPYTQVNAPAGTVAGQLNLVVGAVKPATVDGQTPTGSTGFGAVSNTDVGTGVQGIGTGPLNLYHVSRVLAGASVALTVPISGTPDSGSFVQATFTRTDAAKSYEVTQIGSSTDAVSNTTLAMSWVLTDTVQTGDLLVVLAGTAGNVTFTAQSWVAGSGLTLSISKRYDSGNANGQTSGTKMVTADVTAGSMAAGATLAMNATTSAATTGGAVLIRMREVAAAPVGGPQRRVGRRTY